jgi:hypothetical protein
MKIHVVGSQPHNMTADEFESLKSACRDIGRELASRGHEIAIASLRENTADRHIAEGMKAVEGKKHKLTLYKRHDEKLEALELLPKDRFDVTVQDYKGNRHINALAEGMPMLVIGGQGGTITAGFSAFALKRPVLALPQFGGAAKDIWDAVSIRYGRSLTSDTLDALSGRWTENTAKVVVGALEQLVKNNPFDDRIQGPQILLSSAALVMVFSWVILFSLGPDVGGWLRYLVFFAAIGVASVIGTLTRTFLKVYFDVVEVYSPQRLLSDFVLGLIMGFGFFLFMQASGVLLTGDKLAFDAADFQRLAVLMSLVTLASALLLERSIDRFRERIGKYIEEEKP